MSLNLSILNVLPEGERFIAIIISLGVNTILVSFFLPKLNNPSVDLITFGSDNSTTTDSLSLLTTFTLFCNSSCRLNVSVHHFLIFSAKFLKNVLIDVNNCLNLFSFLLSMDDESADAASLLITSIAFSYILYER